jgi:hypothetical protein
MIYDEGIKKQATHIAHCCNEWNEDIVFSCCFLQRCRRDVMTKNKPCVTLEPQVSFQESMDVQMPKSSLSEWNGVANLGFLKA